MEKRLKKPSLWVFRKPLSRDISPQSGRWTIGQERNVGPSQAAQPPA